MKRVWVLKHRKGYWQGGEDGEDFTHHVNAAVQFVREEDAKAVNASLYYLPMQPVPVSVMESTDETDLPGGSAPPRGDDNPSAA